MDEEDKARVDMESATATAAATTASDGSKKAPSDVVAAEVVSLAASASPEALRTALDADGCCAADDLESMASADVDGMGLGFVAAVAVGSSSNGLSEGGGSKNDGVSSEISNINVLSLNSSLLKANEKSNARGSGVKGTLAGRPSPLLLDVAMCRRQGASSNSCSKRISTMANPQRLHVLNSQRMKPQTLQRISRCFLAAFLLS